MGRATPFAGPDTVTQGDMVIDVPTDRAQFGRRKPRVNMLHYGPRLGSAVVQDVHEGPKAQVGHLASPEGFHSLQVEGFERDVVILSAELVR